MTHDSLDFYAMYRSKFDLAGNGTARDRSSWRKGSTGHTVLRRVIGQILMRSGRILVSVGTRLTGSVPPPSPVWLYGSPGSCRKRG